MAEYLTENSILKYSKGSITGKLIVTSQNFRRIEGLLIATETDKLPLINPPTQC